jgi:glycosyltransferase involved in cell wall biosynthesis
VIAGGVSDSGEYAEQLKELSKDDRRIIFTGFVEGQLLGELYSNSYIYVLPSDLEGMPLSLLEAMSYGNCCLTSNIAECKTVTADHGLTFEKGNSQDLAEKLQMLCDNPQTVENYKNKSAEYILNKYNWDDVTNKTLELYGKL